jgi:hypothetical protein
MDFISASIMLMKKGRFIHRNIQKFVLIGKIDLIGARMAVEADGITQSARLPPLGARYAVSSYKKS